MTAKATARFVGSFLGGLLGVDTSDEKPMNVGAAYTRARTQAEQDKQEKDLPPVEGEVLEAVGEEVQGGVRRQGQD